MNNRILMGNISGIYASSQGFVRDLRKCNTDLSSPYMIQEALLAFRHIKNELKAVGPDGKVFLTLFSRETIIFDRAAKYLSPQEKKQLYVYTYGAVRSFRKKDFGDALNIVSEGDALAMTAIRLRKDMSEMLSSGELMILPSKNRFSDHQYDNENGNIATNIIFERINNVCISHYK